MSRMVVAIVFRDFDQHVTLLFIGHVVGQDETEIVVAGLFQHAVGTQIEVIAWADVFRGDDVCLVPMFQIRLHGPGNDILLRMVQCFFLGYLTNSDQVVHQ